MFHTQEFGLPEAQYRMQTNPFDRMHGAFWCHFPHDLRYGRRTVYAHLLWRRLTGGDFIKVMNEYGHPMPHDVAHAAELRRLRHARVDPAYYHHQIATVRAIVARARGRYPVFATVINAFGQMRGFYGDARMAALLAEDAEAVGDALMPIAEDLAVLARDCVVKGGADGVFFASKGGEASRLDDAGFETVIGRPDRLVLAAACAASPHTILHICGQAVALHRYRDYPAAAVNWDAAHNGAADGLWPQARRMPGLDPRGALRHGDAAAIQTAVHALRAGNGAPTVLAAACTVAGDLPLWRMRTALAAASGGASPGPRPNPLDIAAWHGLHAAARLRGAMGRRLGRPAN